jgi:hypothetical protein
MNISESQPATNAFAKLMTPTKVLPAFPTSSSYRTRPAAYRAKILLLEKAKSKSPDLGFELFTIGTRLQALADEGLQNQKALLAMQRQNHQSTPRFRELEMTTANLLHEEATLRTVALGLIQSKGIKVTKPELEQLVILSSFFNSFSNTISPTKEDNITVHKDGRDDVETDEIAK